MQFDGPCRGLGFREVVHNMFFHVDLVNWSVPFFVQGTDNDFGISKAGIVLSRKRSRQKWSG